MTRVINLDAVTFDCTFGRGCPGLCCKDGRPALFPGERARVQSALPRILPRLRPAARAVVERQGYESRRRRHGRPMLRVIEGWCVFFHDGCVLQRLGVEEGDANRYKPLPCALFPLVRGDDGRWFVRQKGLYDERWALPCLDGASSEVPAAESLREEIALVARLVAQGDERLR